MAWWYASYSDYIAVPQWQASHTYALGTIVRQLASPTVGNERCFRVTTAGTSNSTEPSWNLASSSTTSDNTIVWTECSGQPTYNGDGGGTAWGAPIARLSIAAAFMTAGDYCGVRNTHSETQTTQMTLSFPVNINIPTSVICISGTPANTSSTLATGATVTANSTNNPSITLSISYMYGISLVLGGTGAYAALLQLSYTPFFEQCNFTASDTGSSPKPIFSSTPIELKNCTITFNNSNQCIAYNLGVYWWGPNSAVLGTPPSILAFVGGNYSIFDGVDLSLVTGTLIQSTSGVSVFKNCKLNSGVSVASIPQNYFSVPSLNRVEIQNSDIADSPTSAYRNELYLISGSLKTSTSIYRNTGASDSITAYSWVVSTNSTANLQQYFETFEIAVWGAAGSRTVTVHFLSGYSLNTSDVILSCHYNGSSTSPISYVIDTSPGALTSTTALTADSSSTWTGSSGVSGATYQKITCSFTQAIPGYVRLKVRICKPSATIYIDPLAVIT